MRAKRMIVALAVVAVLGTLVALAALLTPAAPTSAQIPVATPLPITPTPEPTAPPPPTHPSNEDAETLVQLEAYCYELQVYDLNAEVVNSEDGQGKTVSLYWWSDWKYRDFPEEVTPYYRIQRQSHAKDAPTGDNWETVVAAVEDTDSWEGPIEPGHWHYRVRLVGLTSGNLSRECEPQWAEYILNVPTPQEELEQYCEVAYIYNLSATVEPSSGDQEGDTVTLEWETDYEYYYYDYPHLPDDTVVGYRIERMRDAPDDDESSWETVAEVSDKTTWTGPVEPGSWIYRVALVSLQSGDFTGQCSKPNWSYEVEVWVPTAEERVQEENDRRILIEQTTTCATDALASNLTPAAREVVGRHIERKVAEVAREYERSEDLITLAVLFCSDGELMSAYGFSLSSQVLILSMLFDDGFYW